MCNTVIHDQLQIYFKSTCFLSEYTACLENYFHTPTYLALTVLLIVRSHLISDFKTLCLAGTNFLVFFQELCL